jgi:hypothetical protein
MRRRFSLTARLAVVLCTGAVLSMAMACNAVLGIPEVDHLATSPSPSTEGGVRACPPGQKSCSGFCVSVLEPANGCAAAECEPCALPHATSACVQGECAIAACEEGFGNCNAARGDGCEVDLRSDPRNCRDCGADCGDLTCHGGVCQCTIDEDCGYRGSCDQGSCVCGRDQTCSPGAVCDSPDSCEF